MFIKRISIRKNGDGKTLCVRCNINVPEESISKITYLDTKVLTGYRHYLIRQDVGICFRCDIQGEKK